MKIYDVKYRDKYFGEFILEGSAREANLIRKYLIGRVPVYAIDLIKARKNTTAYPIEYIAHRLGMIPIRVLDKNPKEEYEGALTYAGKGKMKTLTSNDLILPNQVEIALYYPQEVKTRIGYEIIDVLPGQEIDLSFTIRANIGFKHAKFQAAIASYEMIEQGKYKIMFETTFQYTAEELLKLVLDYIKKDLKLISDHV